MKKSARGSLIYIIGFAVVLFLINWLTAANTTDSRVIKYDKFLEYVKNQQIKSVVIMDDELYALKSDSQVVDEKFPAEYDYNTYIPSLEQFSEDMKAITNSSKPARLRFQLRHGAAARAVDL